MLTVHTDPYTTLDCCIYTMMRAERYKETRQAVYIQRNIQTRSCNHCCRVKETSIAYSKCVFVALGIQHAVRMRRTILSYVVCPDLHNFSTLSHKRHDFQGGKKVLHIKCVCVDFLYNYCLKRFIITGRIQRDIVLNVHRSCCIVPVILVRF